MVASKLKRWAEIGYASPGESGEVDSPGAAFHHLDYRPGYRSDDRPNDRNSRDRAIPVSGLTIEIGARMHHQPLVLLCPQNGPAACALPFAARNGTLRFRLVL